MVQLTGAAKRFGERVLFEGLDWLATPQDRLGLVGGNGSGKTTLLKILAGMESLDRGEITRSRGLTVGYLPQDGLSLAGRTVFEECLSVFAEVLALEQEQHALAEQLSHLDHAGSAYRTVAERFHRVQDEFQALDGYTIEARVGTVLAGLGFPKQDWERRAEEFSGGWQMRTALAKLLLEKPNLLLLDEPTNHLDLEARNWLEEYLNTYPNAFVIVSHDRYFLDVTVKKVIELWNRGVHFYAGNYSRYETLKQERLAQLEAAHKNQQDKIHQLEVFINRFRYTATKASQVQSRIKELERMERIELPPAEKTIHFRFPQPKASGRVITEFRHVAKSYGANRVFEDAGFVIERGDRIALVGPNGAGKSTLIRLLAGIEPLTAGERSLGHNVEIDYFAQDQYKALDPKARLLDDLSALIPRATQTELRSLLGCFLFSEDDVFKPIGVLSGGERNRYALARMLVVPSNVLLLDEPTNHLDLRAKDVLLNALLDFTGTVVFVSHDRYFIDKLATKVFEVGGGTVNVYSGNYEDYLWRKRVESGESRVASLERGTALKTVKAVAKAGPRINPIKLQEMQRRAVEIEQQTAGIESEIGLLEAQLAGS
ncbi:MAG: ABC-F family ATP-binding cassette domain-containing protein, partial [Acidobacteria bacterium]|nr:ABC-F family ATP-binding cassette domain-containing protein [Acidobacteriota bacterium]